MNNNQNELKNLAHNVAYIRKQNSLSKKEMANILKIGIKSLNKLESAEIPPRLGVSILFNIYNTFSIHPVALLSHQLDDK